MMKRILCLMLVLCCTLTLTGCVSTPENNAPAAPTLPPAEAKFAPPVGDIALNHTATAPLYLPSTDGQRLLTEYVPLSLNHSRHSAQVMVEALLQHPATQTTHALGNGVTLSLYGAQPVEVSSGVCTVNLAANALQLDQQSLYKVCAAITATLCEMDDIQYVNFLVADQAVSMDITGNLPLGGQTALNTAIALDKNGVLDKYNVELIGANIAAIELGEDREKFKGVVERCGAESAKSIIVHSMDEAFAAADELGYPMVVRPSFTMGGLGSGLAYNEKDLRRIAGAGIQYSPTSEVLLEESILGWKEYELEMMRDRNDNVVVVCSIENFDPVGVHTGDSITVAPAMTLTDREYQKLRNIAIAVIREVGVDTGGCNIQFAIEPDTGRVVVIEMNPRVSRSSALASKATGFAIAKIATKLALGYSLDEIPNDITKQTPASFEPTLDYVVVKVPRFAFEKFPAADPTLTTTMKSVGEAMAIGRNFTEALQKALRSLEQKGASLTFAPVAGDQRMAPFWKFW